MQVATVCDSNFAIQLQWEIILVELTDCLDLAGWLTVFQRPKCDQPLLASLSVPAVIT